MAPAAPNPSDPSVALRASVSPNSVGDQPALKDTLGFEPYVQAVAAFLNHPETLGPLTLSVEGAWGSGKSSFMLQLMKALRDKNGKTIWFNAWRHDRNEELWADFALHFTDELAQQENLWERWLFRFKLSYSRFDWRQGWFPLTKFALLLSLFVFFTVNISGFWFNHQAQLSQLIKVQPKWDELLYDIVLAGGGLGLYGLVGFGVFRKLSDILGNPLKAKLTKYLRDPKYETRAAFIETFHADFTRLVSAHPPGTRIFVFIDDLDRCEVPRAADLMQALNLLISESLPVFYVLGLDREKIAAGLAAKYEKLLPYLSTKKAGTTNTGVIGAEFGYSFLEKFIQIPFLVPQPSNPDLDRLLDSLGSSGEKEQTPTASTKKVDPGLLVELSSDSSSVRDVVKMVAPSFEYNPRRLKQFINLFRLRALLASQTGLFGAPTDEEAFSPLSFEQLGKLVAIMLRWPLLLSDLRADATLIVKLQELAWGIDPEETSDAAFLYWSNKSSLIDLIAFPGKASERIPEEEKGKYGLHRIDIDRVLRIAPPVPGRGLADGPSRHPDISAGVPQPPLGREGAFAAGTDDNWTSNLGPKESTSASQSGRRPAAEPGLPFPGGGPADVLSQPPDKNAGFPQQPLGREESTVESKEAFPGGRGEMFTSNLGPKESTSASESARRPPPKRSGLPLKKK
jgi:hypothetical protein